MVSRMVRNTPRKGLSWRTRVWRRWHDRHGVVVSVNMPTYRADSFGVLRYRADQSIVIYRCGKGHERRVR